jgi:hypothetical protein
MNMKMTNSIIGTSAISRKIKRRLRMDVPVPVALTKVPGISRNRNMYFFSPTPIF